MMLLDSVSSPPLFVKVTKRPKFVQSQAENLAKAVSDYSAKLLKASRGQSESATVSPQAQQSFAVSEDAGTAPQASSFSEEIRILQEINVRPVDGSGLGELIPNNPAVPPLEPGTINGPRIITEDPQIGPPDDSPTLFPTFFSGGENPVTEEIPVFIGSDTPSEPVGITAESEESSDSSGFEIESDQSAAPQAFFSGIIDVIETVVTTVTGGSNTIPTPVDFPPPVQRPVSQPAPRPPQSPGSRPAREIPLSDSSRKAITKSIDSISDTAVKANAIPNLNLLAKNEILAVANSATGLGSYILGRGIDRNVLIDTFNALQERFKSSLNDALAVLKGRPRESIDPQKFRRPPDIGDRAGAFNNAVSGRTEDLKQKLPDLLRVTSSDINNLATIGSLSPAQEDLRILLIFSRDIAVSILENDATPGLHEALGIFTNGIYKTVGDLLRAPARVQAQEFVEIDLNV